ncbi:PLC-like phosphodiesterase [Bombardia bombarda]|uniref:PLC-like phosphodiesterase n=1 Tax=Bombardia bombarda TaxID=252184 RepID=A0AA39XCQ6_9PEZI|nr:PLC-like phosphodiesterase [Bombardia bombarda]
MAALAWLLVLHFHLLSFISPSAGTATTTTLQTSQSLADLALKKVLADSAQVFGEYSPSSSPNKTTTTTTTTTTSRARWMRQIPDAALLTQLSIPGTHDSATWNFSQATRDSLAHNTDPANGVFDAVFYRCQAASPAAALDAGIRFFDLRYALDPTGTALAFYHKAALMSQRATVEDVLFGFYAWLEAHPSEVVILSFQYEGGRPNEPSGYFATAQGLLAGVLTGSRYVLQQRGELGTLGQARGRIVVFQRFDLPTEQQQLLLPGLHFSPSLWPDNGKDFVLTYNTARNLSAYIEDYYEPNDLGGANLSAVAIIDAKVAAVEAHLNKAAGGGDDLYITFTSAEYNLNDPHVTPEIMALGNGTELTPQGGVNQQLVGVLKGLRGKRLGIVVLDFWDQPGDVDLVGAVLGL